MSIYRGTNKIAKVFRGTQEIKNLYRGTQKVFSNKDVIVRVDWISMSSSISSKSISINESVFDTSTTRIETTISLKDVQSSQFTSVKQGTFYFELGISNGNADNYTLYNFGSTTNTKIEDLVVDEKNTYTVDKNGVYKNGSKIADTTYTTKTRTVRSLSIGNSLYFKFYGFKVYNNDQLIVNIIPIYSINKRQYGFMDTISGNKVYNEYYIGAEYGYVDYVYNKGSSAFSYQPMRQLNTSTMAYEIKIKMVKNQTGSTVAQRTIVNHSLRVRLYTDKDTTNILYKFGKTTEMFFTQLNINELATLKVDKDHLYKNGEIIGNTDYDLHASTSSGFSVFLGTDCVRTYGVRKYTSGVLDTNFVPIYDINAHQFGIKDIINGSMQTGANIVGGNDGIVNIPEM